MPAESAEGRPVLLVDFERSCFEVGSSLSAGPWHPACAVFSLAEAALAWEYGVLL
jgi:hypothetical protein